MAGVLQHLRSSTLDKRPNPASMVDGQVAINYASGAPGMFFKDSNGSLVKVGPVHVGSSAPNAVPASGGTAGNSIGEQWLDNSGGTYVFKIWDGAAWRSEAGEFVNATGDTMTGDLVMNNANLVFEGSVEDSFETTLTVVNPTADRTITLPNVTGTVVTTGDSGTVTSTMIADGTIVNADVNASAAIAGTKISPNFGSQTIQTTGIISAAGGSAAAPSIAFTGDTNTGIYSPGADQVAISTNGTGRLFVDSSGNVGVGTTSVDSRLHVNSGAVDQAAHFQSSDSNVRIKLTDGDATNSVFVVGKGDSLAFETAGNNERARIDSFGRLLVGTSSSLSAGNWSDSFIQVRGNSSGSTFEGKLALFTGKTIASGIGAGESLGRVAFGNGEGGEAAWITAQADAGWSASDYPGRLTFSTTADGASSPTERMVIKSNGDIRINQNTTSTPGLANTTTGVAIENTNAIFASRASGIALFLNRNNDGASVEFHQSGNVVGTISVTASATAFNTSSDYRLKENVVPLTGAADRLKLIPVHRFNFIADPDTTVDGFIAHEAQAVVPECVTGAKDEVDEDGTPVYQGIDQSKIVPLLTAALQEALAKIEVLEQRLTDAGIA